MGALVRLGTVDGAEAALTAASQRLGALVTDAIASSRTRADALAASAAVRGAVETDVATVRDMARAGNDLMLAPTPHEVIELFQLALIGAAGCRSCASRNAYARWRHARLTKCASMKRAARS